MTNNKKHTTISIYLSSDERLEVDQLAKKAGYNRHAFLQWLLRKAISEYKKGKLKPKTKKVLDHDFS